MKKFVIIFLCWIIFWVSATPVLAADALHRMLNADKETQDAMIVGQLMEQNEGRFAVRVLKVLSGKVDADTIWVDDDFHYGWGETTPAVNDFCVWTSPG